MTDKAENARKRIADAANQIAQDEKEQESAEYPATQRAEQIRETAGD